MPLEKRGEETSFETSYLKKRVACLIILEVALFFILVPNAEIGEIFHRSLLVKCNVAVVAARMIQRVFRWSRMDSDAEAIIVEFWPVVVIRRSPCLCWQDIAANYCGAEPSFRGNGGFILRPAFPLTAR